MKINRMQRLVFNRHDLNHLKPSHFYDELIFRQTVSLVNIDATKKRIVATDQTNRIAVSHLSIT